MRLSFSACMAVCFSLLLWGTYVNAAQYEYSDAPDRYGTARHVDGTWQRLGSAWDREYAPLNTNRDTSDDGVVWSVDGGATWGNDTLIAGQNVTFGFEFTRAGYGRHEYDALDAWVDWNGDGFWSDDERIINVTWDKGDTLIPDDEYWDFYDTNGTVINPDAELTAFFVTEAFTVTDEMDELWLRARVACNTSLGSDGITPYNNIHQGEVEDWQVNVNPVPEPGTLVLLGCGILGLARACRKQSVL
ncbi:MAG: PEP-CTERM sorting domain-containing protein [Desulfobacter sp.]